jgi:alkylated DNA repair dioxygenase AlkB
VLQGVFRNPFPSHDNRLKRNELLSLFSHELQSRVAGWVCVCLGSDDDRGGTRADPASLSEALVTEYVPGAVIGWHRDAPTFGPVVVGFSLGAACRLRLRRGHGKERDAVARVSVVLEPRSGYVLAGPARSEWQHSIPAVDALRYSITFRSVKTRR